MGRKNTTKDAKDAKKIRKREANQESRKHIKTCTS